MIKVVRGSSELMQISSLKGRCIRIYVLSQSHHASAGLG